MNKTNYEELLNEIVSTGCTYADIYKQKSKRKIYSLIDSKIDSIKMLKKEGIGLRSILTNHSKYVATNDLSFDNLMEKAKLLNSYYNGKRVIDKITLKEQEVDAYKVKLKYTYRKDLGYDKEGTLYLVKNVNKLEVALYNPSLAEINE